MRELPLNNSYWVSEHVHFMRIGNEGYISFNHLSMIREYSELSTDKFRYLSQSQNMKNKLLVFIDPKTDELFKYTVPVDDSYSLAKIFASLLNVYKPQLRIKPDECDELRISIHSRCIGSKGLTSVQGNLIHKYLENNFNLKLLKPNDISIFKKYAKSIIRNEDLIVDGLPMDSIVIDIIKDNDHQEFKDEFLNELENLYEHSNIVDIINDHKGLLKIKFDLLNMDNGFTGVYTVKQRKFNNQDKRRVFDGIDVELNMYSDYDENLRFVKKNLKEIKKLIKLIIETHPKCKDYAKFIDMYSFVLTRENILVARFCFKAGLEELCK